LINYWTQRRYLTRKLSSAFKKYITQSWFTQGVWQTSLG